MLGVYLEPDFILSAMCEHATTYKVRHHCKTVMSCGSFNASQHSVCASVAANNQGSIDYVLQQDGR